MARPTGLGKGLDALIPGRDPRKPTRDGGDGDGSGLGLRNLDVKSISPNPNQPRIHFDDESLAELAASIRAVGLLQPILVRPKAGSTNSFELIAGERRWRASQRAGLTVIPALVRETDDVASVEQALVENLHRQDLTPLEEAAAYKQLLDDFSMTHEQVAEKVGKTRSAITNSLRLLALPPSIQQLLADGRLSGGHARALLALTDRTTQEQLARQCANDGWTVRAVEEAVRQNLGRTKATSKTTSTNSSTTKTSTKSTTMPQPGLVELERLLGEHLATNVSVTSTNGRGKVVVEFADLNDLERIYRAMTEGPAVSD
ncbi:MAG: ParB/RepB/Spo0J family partition protein [Ilumatobacteraceae bacterium]|nr:ParB/RepB/Spo0J family partition protein [Ilumatobacteraceae bacterium]MBJ7421488.1 ParB/RepB/Spo0J family partition protein [Ilumatobacteraceae bacterium]